jgi:hypothetical protein
MYENKYKNPDASRTKDLDTFLKLVADLDTEIELFAIGGTAMVLKGIKEATKDIDFMTTCGQDTIRRLLKTAGLKEESASGACNIWYLDRIRIDVFYGPAIMGVPLPPDWRELSEHVRDIGKVKLYILDWYDIIITKIARSEERDYADALAIIQHQRMDTKKLKERYYGLAEVSLIPDYDYKFKHLERLLRKK